MTEGGARLFSSLGPQRKRQRFVQRRELRRPLSPLARSKHSDWVRPDTRRTREGVPWVGCEEWSTLDGTRYRLTVKVILECRLKVPV